MQTQINGADYDGKVAEDGFVDYAQDNINTIEPEEEQERHGERFDPEAVRRREEQLAKEREEAELAAANKKKKGPSFVLPSKVKDVGNKIRNLFFRNNQSETIDFQAKTQDGD